MVLIGSSYANGRIWGCSLKIRAQSCGLLHVIQSLRVLCVEVFNRGLGTPPFLPSEIGLCKRSLSLVPRRRILTRLHSF